MLPSYASWSLLRPLSKMREESYIETDRMYTEGELGPITWVEIDIKIQFTNMRVQPLLEPGTVNNDQLPSPDFFSKVHNEIPQTLCKYI